MASKKIGNAISPTRGEDYPEWYQQVIRAAELAETSPVRGCMVIKPWGYAIWENMQRELDRMFKATGHRNAYFPIFIPRSFLEKEAEHVEGFATECAVVTHSRLERSADGTLVPASPLEEPLVVRPTSETMVGEMFSRWVQSYRDLPLLINQWANVVRWEMRTRLFLRTTEFLWQEGHTVHASAEEAMEETRQMLAIYADFCENYMAMPVIQGEKTERERFPGAVTTLSIEAMMQDRKALQAGTSHFLGQNFSRGSDISFLDEEGKEVFAWTTSWGVSTRLIGALIMTHSDDDGLVLPPRLAPSHIVILPILHRPESREAVLQSCHELREELANIQWDGRPLEVILDSRDLRGGEKMWQWVKKGIPVWIEVGPRDLEKNSVFVGRRDLGVGARYSLGRGKLIGTIGELLDNIQSSLFERAAAFRREHTAEIDSEGDFLDFFTPRDSAKRAIHGGWAWAHWNGDREIEERIANELKVTIRSIPLDRSGGPGRCVFTGEPSGGRVVFAKAY